MTAVEFSPQERARLDAIEAAEPAPESFDAVAACRRVLDLADQLRRGEHGDPGRGVVAWMMQVAVNDGIKGDPS